MRQITKKNNYMINFFYRREDGFSLIEVIVVIAIVGIITAVAIPNFATMKTNFQLKAAARDLYSGMQKARLEAVKRNTNVAISFTTATPGGGYQIFIDDGAGGGTSGNAVRDGSEVLLTDLIMPMKCSLVSTTFTGNRTGYNSQGLPLGNRIGNVQIRNDDSTRWYQIALSNSGHVKLEISADGVF